MRPYLAGFKRPLTISTLFDNGGDALLSNKRQSTIEPTSRIWIATVFNRIAETVTETRAKISDYIKKRGLSHRGKTSFISGAGVS
jgi:hypothetical protein